MNMQGAQKKDGQFINPHIQDIKRDLWDAILWRCGYYADGVSSQSPEGFLYPAQPLPTDPTRPSAVWIGHSTFLIRIGGLSFLSDPLFGSYCSPIHMQAFKRLSDPALSIDELPPIHVVLISHNHYDHLDEQSILQLARHSKNIQWIVPIGVKRWFDKRGIESVSELTWGQSVALSFPCRITAVPCQHFSGRHMWDKNRTLWCGYIVETAGKTFYFVGDTGYNPFGFKEIGDRWPEIDLSLIPIGTYVPKTFMQTVHISPYDAVAIHVDVRSHLSLGMHWKTFCLSDEPLDLPPYDLYLAMKQRKLPFETFLPVDPGQNVNW
jgi:N-acyl-phosphatidylethanolamine-hydrolysing phospholipase D